MLKEIYYIGYFINVWMEIKIKSKEKSGNYFHRNLQLQHNKATFVTSFILSQINFNFPGNLKINATNFKNLNIFVTPNLASKAFNQINHIMILFILFCYTLLFNVTLYMYATIELYNPIFLHFLIQWKLLRIEACFG